MRITVLALAVATATSVFAQEPKELGDARQEYNALKYPTEADRVRYVTRLVRLRESFTRAEAEKMFAIDAEVMRHPMPAKVPTQVLVKRLVGRWQSPRHDYFYHGDGTWASDEDTYTGEVPPGAWRIEGNKFFQNYTGDPPDKGEVIVLLTDTDFVYATREHPFYLRRGTIYPWRD